MNIWLFNFGIITASVVIFLIYSYLSNAAAATKEKTTSVIEKKLCVIAKVNSKSIPKTLCTKCGNACNGEIIRYNEITYIQCKKCKVYTKIGRVF